MSFSYPNPFPKNIIFLKTIFSLYASALNANLQSSPVQIQKMAFLATNPPNIEEKILKWYSSMW